MACGIRVHGHPGCASSAWRFRWTECMPLILMSMPQPPAIASDPMQVLHPKHWAAAKGFANGIAAEGQPGLRRGSGRLDAEQVFESDDFAAQTEQALRNIVEVLAEAGARPEHIVRLTWYVTSKHRVHRAPARRRRRLPPRARPALPGHDAGAGGGPGGGPRQGRDRGNGGGAPPTGCLMSPIGGCNAWKPSCQPPLDIAVRRGCRSICGWRLPARRGGSRAREHKRTARSRPSSPIARIS